MQTLRDRSDPCDVLIVGSGLVGSSLAIALDQSGLDVVLVEARAAEPDHEASVDERNLALARASVNALTALGVWTLVGNLAAPIRRIHVSRRGDFGAVRLDAAQLDATTFGAVLPARELGNALLARLESCPDLERIVPASVVAVQAGEACNHVTLRTESGERQVDARLVVAADGTESFVRSVFGIGTRREDYGQSIIVTTLKAERSLDGTAFERFTDSGPVAVLQLANGRVGLALTVPSTQADQVAGLDDDAFIAFVHDRFGYRVGRLSQPGRRKPYPITRVLADTLVGPRVALVGNAAQTIHPIGAQGFNLGLRDALMLAELLDEAARDKSDPGALELLASYAERRRSDRDATTSFSDDLVRLMGSEVLPIRLVRSFGFHMLDRITPLKRRFALRGMGFRGDSPTLALHPLPGGRASSSSSRSKA